MEVILEKVKIENKNKLSKLLEVYLEELFEKSKKETGPYKYFDKYFTEPNRHPFFIKVDGKLAGFILVNLKDPLTNGKKQEISEFYITPLYRNKGIGNKSVVKIFNKYPGDWVVRVLKNNPAEKFWIKNINGYTKGDYEKNEQKNKKWNWTVFTFTN